VGISKDKLATAVALLKEEGYTTHYVKVPQLGTGKETTIKVLAKPDTPYSQVYQNKDKIRQISEHSEDGGRTYGGLRPPTNVSSKRIDIVYDEQGGSTKDGLIELRPGVKDLDMGGANYAQVRIAVDKTHYLKGMAVYNPDLPEGVDIRFNTNKKDTGNKHDAMKEMEKGPDGKPNLETPFSASIKPGGQRGALNIVNEEGDWDRHARNLPAQMLSKQVPALARQQLAVTSESRRSELDRIKELTNPAVKKKMLKTFADETDAAAVHLKAAALPRQASKVLLPIPQVRETEIYAPGFRNGERVVLVRFPHGGTFEIPELTVNNRNRIAQKLIGTSATDAVGINHKVAERLSGADFDGDHVLVIPNNRGQVKYTDPLKGLVGFDPKAAHPAYPGMPRMTAAQKQNEMGKITNLIADMTIQGAGEDDLARAVRHSMVVIDAEKHNLDYRGSFKANGIPALKAKYQGQGAKRPEQAGASTLITRAGSDAYINKRKPRPASQGGPIDKATGKLVFVEDDRATYTNAKGKTVTRKERHDRLAITDDAHTLVSANGGTRIEAIYADHSNQLKAMANEARKEMVHTKATPYSPSAKQVYSNEVSSLNAKLNTALKNAPLERQAQIVANAMVSQKKAANPGLDSDDLKKVKNQALAEARVRTGAGKKRIDITQKEWDAIQAGAISNHKLEQILDNADIDMVKQLATPKRQVLMTSTKTARAKQMLASGYTQAEVADALGVSLTTLKTGIS
jgi:hypothetical protein